MSRPAYREQSSAPAAPVGVPEPVEEAEVKEDKEEIEEKGSKKKSGGKSKGGKKGGKGKDKKEAKEEEEDESKGAAEEGEMLLIDEIWPKKEALGLTKWYVSSVSWDELTESHDRISIYTINSIPLFFNHFDGPFIPSLKLLHQCESRVPLEHLGTRLNSLLIRRPGFAA